MESSAHFPHETCLLECIQEREAENPRINSIYLFYLKSLFVVCIFWVLDYQLERELFFKVEDKTGDCPVKYTHK